MACTARAAAEATAEEAATAATRRRRERLQLAHVGHLRRVLRCCREQPSPLAPAAAPRPPPTALDAALEAELYLARTPTAATAPPSSARARARASLPALVDALLAELSRLDYTLHHANVVATAGGGRRGAPAAGEKRAAAAPLAVANAAPHGCLRFAVAGAAEAVGVVGRSVRAARRRRLAVTAVDVEAGGDGSAEVAVVVRRRGAWEAPGAEADEVASAELLEECRGVDG